MLKLEIYHQNSHALLLVMVMKGLTNSMEEIAACRMQTDFDLAASILFVVPPSWPFLEQ